MHTHLCTILPLLLTAIVAGTPQVVLMLGEAGSEGIQLTGAIHTLLESGKVSGWNLLPRPSRSPPPGVQMVPFESDSGNQYLLHECETPDLCVQLATLEQFDGAVLRVVAPNGPTRDGIEAANSTGIANIVVFLEDTHLVDEEELLELVELEIRELLSKYDFDGDSTPIVHGALTTEEAVDSGVQTLLEEIDDVIG